MKKKAEELGAAAFAKGWKGIPALDPDLRQLMKETPNDILPLLDAYIAGFTEANLSAPVPGWTAEENAAFQARRKGAKGT